eukprot:ctg_4810.g640
MSTGRRWRCAQRTSVTSASVPGGKHRTGHYGAGRYDRPPLLVGAAYRPAGRSRFVAALDAGVVPLRRGHRSADAQRGTGAAVRAPVARRRQLRTPAGHAGTERLRAEHSDDHRASRPDGGDSHWWWWWRRLRCDRHLVVARAAATRPECHALLFLGGCVAGAVAARDHPRRPAG